MHKLDATLAAVEQRLSRVERTSRVLFDLLQRQAVLLNGVSTIDLDCPSMAAGPDIPAERECFQSHCSLPKKSYVELLISGRKTAQFLPLVQAERLLKSQNFDIRIDDLKSKLKVSHKPWQCIYDVSPVLRGMLWLILTQVSQSRITYLQIAHLLGYPKDSVSERDSRIHQYPRRLREELLGKEITARVLGNGVKKTYPIKTDTWSFCWLRLNANPECSSLLHELPGREAKVSR